MYKATLKGMNKLPAGTSNLMLDTQRMTDQQQHKTVIQGLSFYTPRVLVIIDDGLWFLLMGKLT